MKRKLIYRSGAIGDIIHCLPAIKLLHKLEPDTRIDLVVGTEQVRRLLIAGAPYIDNIYVAMRPKDSSELMDSLKDYPVDEFIFLHSNLIKPWFWQQSIIHARKLTIYRKDRNLGARENFAVTLFPDLREELATKQHTPEIFKLLDYKCLDFKGSNSRAETLSAIVSESLPEKPPGTSPASPQKYICIIPGVGHVRPTRAYPLEYWIELINTLLRDTDLKIKILGGPDEEAISHELFISFAAEAKTSKTSIEERVENLVGKTSLVDLLGIFAQAQFVLSADTGMLHIASALGAKTISIYAVTSELRTGPHSPFAQVLRSNSCACDPLLNNKGNEQKHCSRTRGTYASCVWDITSAELATRCYDLMKTSPQAAPRR